MQVKHAVAAGGVVHRGSGGKIEVVLCGRSQSGVWGLPKGTPNLGEGLEETAIREVNEETGLEVKIEAKIGSIRYWYMNPAEEARYHKTVHHYLMLPIGGDISLHDPEYDLVQWFSAEEACRTLTYQNETKIVRKAALMVTEIEHLGEA